MKCLEKVSVVMLGAALAASAQASTSNVDNPKEHAYRSIVDRNPFGLKDPPPPAPAQTAPVIPKVEILLTGITSIMGKKAYFMTKEAQGGKTEYYSLGEDEKKDGLEVLAIDEVAKTVRIRNSGSESLLNFAANGVKPPAHPPSAVPGTPGAPGLPGMAPIPGLPGAPQPGMPNPNALRGVATPGLSAIPSFAPPPTGVSSTTATPTSTSSSRVRTIPSRNLRVNRDSAAATWDASTGQPAPNPAQVVPQQHTLSPEQQVLMMELQRAANPNVVYPPIPAPVP